MGGRQVEGGGVSLMTEIRLPFPFAIRRRKWRASRKQHGDHRLDSLDYGIACPFSFSHNATKGVAISCTRRGTAAILSGFARSRKTTE